MNGSTNSTDLTRGDAPLFKRRYPELDLIRAVAITLVLMFHITGDFHLPPSLFSKAASWGYHGVDLFFVLSGFLIGGQIIEENLSGGFSFKRFYMKRVWRIFPPYYLSLMIYVILMSVAMGGFALTDPAVLKDVLVHVFYLQDYIHPQMYASIYWSLAVEEQFYIVMPLLTFLIVYYLRRRVFAALAALALAGIALRFVLYYLSIGTNTWWDSFYSPLHARFDILLFGVIAAYIFIKYADRLYGLSFIWKALMLAVAVIAIAISFIFSKFGEGYFSICWDYALSGLGFSALILFLVTAKAGRYLPFKNFVGLVAKFSYTMYLYHIVLKMRLVSC